MNPRLAIRTQCALRPPRRQEHLATPVVVWVLLALCACCAAQVRAQEAQGAGELLSDLFRYRAAVRGPEAVSAGDLVRLPLQAEIVERCAADFSDLRIAVGDRFLPYVIDSGGEWTGTVLTSPAPLLAFDTTRLAGEAPQDRADPPRLRETMRLAPPPPGRDWWLVASTDRASFSRTVELWSGDPGTTEAVLRRSGQTLFRLQRPLREALRLRVGEIAGGDMPLTVVLEGEGPALQPHWQWVRTLRGEQAPPIVSNFVLERRTGGALVFERPPAVLPEALEIVTNEPLLRAEVRVWEDGGAGEPPRLLGGATVFRTGLGGSESLSIPLSRAPQRTLLRLTIGDASAPPPFQFELRASAPAPTLVFAWPPDGNSPTLLFGGARVRPSNSGLDELTQLLSAAADLVGGELSAGVVRGPDAKALLDLRSAQLPVCRAASPEDNPRYESRPRLAHLLEPGAAAQPARFSHRRLVALEEARDGLTEQRLSPGDLAVLKPDFSDLRFIDEDQLQRPHRVLPANESDVLTQAVEVFQETQERITTVRLEATWSPLPITAVELALERAFFDRSAVLTAVLADGSKAVLFTGRLHKQSDFERVRLSWPALGAQRVRRVVLEIDDGDDAPLQITQAWYEIPTRRVQLIAPSGSYTMLLGDPDLEAPLYEALRAQELLLENLRVGTLRASALEPNPAYEPSRRIAGALSQPQPWFWLLLVAAAVFLAVLTLRTLGAERAS